MAYLKKARSRKGTGSEVFDAQKTGQWCTVFWAFLDTAVWPIIAFWLKALAAPYLGKMTIAPSRYCC